MRYCTLCGRKLLPDGRCPFCQMADTSRTGPQTAEISRFTKGWAVIMAAIAWSLTTACGLFFLASAPLVIFPGIIPAVIICVGLWKIFFTETLRGIRFGLTLIAGSLLAAMIIFTVFFSIFSFSGFLGIFYCFTGQYTTDTAVCCFKVGAATLACMLIALPVLAFLRRMVLTARGVLRNGLTTAETYIYPVVGFLILSAAYAVCAAHSSEYRALWDTLFAVLSYHIPAAFQNFVNKAVNFNWTIMPISLLLAAASCLCSAITLGFYNVRVGLVKFGLRRSRKKQKAEERAERRRAAVEERERRRLEEEAYYGDTPENDPSNSAEDEDA